MSFKRTLRRGAVLVAGGALMVAGAAMLVLPGPGVLVLFGGLALLATEFTWADRLLQWAKTTGRDLAFQLRDRWRQFRGKPPLHQPRQAIVPPASWAVPPASWADEQPTVPLQWENESPTVVLGHGSDLPEPVTQQLRQR